MSLQSTFSQFSVGDVIATVNYSYVVCREVHPTHIAKSVPRYALARICSCDDHAEYVLPDSYAWNDDRQALTKVDGTALPGWTNNATVERNAYQNADLDQLCHTMTMEEIPHSWEDPLDDEGNTLLLQKALNGAKYARTEQMQMLSILKAIGIETTGDQAVILAKMMRKSATQTQEEVDLAAFIGALAVSLSRPW